MPAGRPFKQRRSYVNDAAFINRITLAVENDDSRPVKWRNELIAKLKEASIMMLQAPQPTKED